MIKLYENASKVNPKNENLANQWFMSLARTLDFKGQQQVQSGYLQSYGETLSQRSYDSSSTSFSIVGGASTSQEL